MKTFKVVFSKPKNKILPLGSYLIRWYMGTPYSHVSYHFTDYETGEEVVYEAVGNGLRYISKKRWEQHAYATCSFEMRSTPETYREIKKTCIKFAGQGYGYLQNIGIVLADLFHLKHNPFPENQNCSEVLARILEKQGVVFNKNKNLLTPRDIENALLLKFNYLHIH